MAGKNGEVTTAVEMLPVGTVEIAEFLGVTRKHVDAWRTRGGRRGVPFPVPRWTVGGRPAWLWTDIQAWYAATQPA